MLTATPRGSRRGRRIRLCAASSTIGRAKGSGTRWTKSLRAQIRRSARKIVLDFQVGFTDAPLQPLHGLTCPVRLLSGGRSRVPTRRIISFLAAQFPAAKLEVVDDANHLLPMTHTEMLRAFLLRELVA